MKAYVFDVDGVLTNPLSKHANKDVLSQIYKRLKDGSIVCFNTGRSFEWTRERVLSPLTELVQGPDLLTHVMAACEMGNILVEYKSGWTERVLPAAFLPQKLGDSIRTIVERDFSDSMFYDDKKTMISVEIIDGYDHQKYLELQQALLQEIKEILAKPEYNKLNLKTTSNEIAIDVQNENSGKKLGAKRVISWIKEKGFHISSAIAFGDNASDLEMADIFQESFPTEFVFVGERTEQINGTSPILKLIFTKDKFEKGTLEFLTTS